MFRLLAVLLLTSSAIANPAEAVAKTSVAVSVLPLKGITQTLGGNLVEIDVLVEPGQSPANYEPRPQQLASLSSSRLLVAAGVPFESVWLPRIRANFPRLRILELSPAATAPHDHDTIDPHRWMNPRELAGMAEKISAELISIDPDNRQIYANNLRQLQLELTQLDHEIETMLAPVKERRFVIFHPALGHFAERYNLQQIAIEHEGKSPGPAQMAELITLVRDTGIELILIQQQFDKRVAESIADATGARIVEIDPLSDDYFNNMRQIAAIIRGNR